MSSMPTTCRMLSGCPHAREQRGDREHREDERRHDVATRRSERSASNSSSTMAASPASDELHRLG